MEAINQKILLQGIGGWLWIPAINLFLGALTLIVNSLDTPYPILKIVNIIILMYVIVTMYFFFKAKKNAPRLMIVWYALIGLLGFPAFFLSSTQDAGPRLMATLISSGIWIAYFLISKRVRNTFVK